MDLYSAIYVCVRPTVIGLTMAEKPKLFKKFRYTGQEEGTQVRSRVNALSTSSKVVFTALELTFGMKCFQF